MKRFILFEANFKSNLHYTRGITPKLVTSGGIHLRNVAKMKAINIAMSSTSAATNVRMIIILYKASMFLDMTNIAIDFLFFR